MGVGNGDSIPVDFIVRTKGYHVIHVCLSFASRARKEWREFVEEPKAPSNYKKQETIDNYIAERWTQLELGSADLMLGGEVMRIGVLPLQNTSIGVDVGEFHNFSPTEFVQYIRRLQETDKGNYTLYGFNTGAKLQQLMFTLLEMEKAFPFYLTKSVEGVSPRIVNLWSGNSEVSIDSFLDVIPGMDLREIRNTTLPTMTPESGMAYLCDWVYKTVTALGYLEEY